MDRAYEFLADEAPHEHGAPVKMWTRGVPVDEASKKQLANTASMPFIYKWLAVMPDVHLARINAPCHRRGALGRREALRGYLDAVNCHPRILENFCSRSHGARSSTGTADLAAKNHHSHFKSS